jgi:DNA polymerase/3'-5' exonuclease PolX
MRKEIPTGVLEMLAVPGLRPDNVVKLYKTLGVTSLAGLEQAAREDHISGVKGLGGARQAPAKPRNHTQRRRPPPHPPRRRFCSKMPNASSNPARS